MVEPIHWVLHHMTVVAGAMILQYMEYGTKKIPTSGSDSKCLGEIWQYESFFAASLDHFVCELG
jgi:hypothetical protein